MNTFLALLTLAIAGHVHCWDQSNRNYILDIHNEMRRRPGACEMNKMEYDMDLENQARGWAQRCAFKHEMKKGRGENLAFDTNKYEETKLIDIATDSWYDEIKMYSYGQSSCSMSCHYSQLVWAKTTKVGCYSHRCPNLSGGARDAWFLVCFYTPMGNWMGEKPYKKSCSAKCAKGQTEDKGLCVGKAVVDENESDNILTAEENEGSKQTCQVDLKECKDTTSKCAGWASKGECDRNPNYMKSKCQKSCNACECEYNR